MNPDGFGGMGQILSPDYDMINYSNVPIEIEITDIFYEFADPENCVSLSDPNKRSDIENQGKKTFYLYLGQADLAADGDLIKKYYDEYIDGQEEEWGSQNLSGSVMASDNDILITDAHLQKPITLILAPSIYNELGEVESTPVESRASFRFFGNMSTNPDVEWFDDNVILKITYKYKEVEIKKISE